MDNSLLGWAGQGNPADKDIDVQIFTSSGTWIKPANAEWVHVALSSGGTGGTSGRKGVLRTALLDGNGLSVSGGYASAPDSAALDITGDIDIQANVQLADWTPATLNGIVGKWTGAQSSYFLGVNTNGTLILSWSQSGASGQFSHSSTVATGIADGASRWVRATMDVDNGASQRVVKFYTSTDGSAWTQLGTTITTSGITSIFSGTSPLEIGATSSGGSNVMSGYVHRVIVRNGYDGAGSTVFDANFATATIGASSFTESSVNAATVTITSSLQGRTGGGSGSGGGNSWADFDAASLPNNVSVVVGAGGSGAAAQTINNANGNGSTGGGTTTFGTYLGAAAATLLPSAGTAGTMVTVDGGRGVISGGAGNGNNANGGRGGNGFPNLFNGGGGAGASYNVDIEWLPAAAGTAYSVAGGFSRIAGLVGVGGNGGIGGLTAGTNNAGQDGILGGGGGGGGYGTNYVCDGGAGGRGGSGFVIVTTYLNRTNKPIDVQPFTSNGTWYKPTDPRLTTARIFVMAGGGGGGAGRCDGNSNNRFGGGGGGSGGVSYLELPLSMLSNSYAVTVGLGGTGGTGVSTVATNGGNGTNGGISSFGSLINAIGGQGGFGGTATTGTSGMGGTGTYGIGLSGGAGATGVGTAAAAGAGWTSGGGGGSGITSGNATSAGSTANPAWGYFGAVSATAAATNAASIAPGAGMFGGIGGGGGASSGTPTRNGGNGSRGSGGGGGAASQTNTTSGNGGNGGDGIVVVVCV